MSLRSTAWRWLIVGHRWLGIATCLLFAMWFASGLVMMYVGFPDLTRAERLALSQRIDWRQVTLTPERVLHELQLQEFPRELRLVMMNGEPVYRIKAAGSPPRSVSAVDGHVIDHVTPMQALAIVRAATEPLAAAVAARDDATRLSFVHAGAPRSIGDEGPAAPVQPHSVAVQTLHNDQWTVAGTFDFDRPLYRIALHDERGTELYVSSHSGEIMLDTTARERTWNWVGAVLHWLYFRDLRAKPAVWSQVVLWTSGVGIAVALTGLWLGIDRLRIRRRNGNSAMTPYRGWMAWHHLAGIVGGLFLLTWIFSGWLSMGPPVPWSKKFDAQRMAAGVAAYSGSSTVEFGTPLSVLQQLDDREAREASFMWVLGRPQIVLTDGAQNKTVLDGITGAERKLAEQDLIDAAPRLAPDAHLVATQRLDHEDAYWYSRRADRTLPVLRFIFDDADRTWVHVDPQTGRVISWMRASDRVHRWLFNAFHSLDFRWLLAHRPAWDLVMWLLSIAGLAISTSSVVIGWRRLRR